MPTPDQLRHRLTPIWISAVLFIGIISLNATTVRADGCSAANFKGGRNFVVGQYPWALAPGDFNNDGKSDVAAADYYGNNVRIALGDGAGGFASVTTYATGQTPIAIAAGDLTGDGRPDLVVTNFDSNNISVLLNDGSGNFTVTNYGAGVGPGEIALADINDDSILDVAVLNQTGGAILVFPNNGTGGLLPFSFIVLPPSSNPTDIVSADFNHDNKADFATANTSNSFSVVLRTGMNSFAPPTTTTNNFLADLKSIAVGDFTGDTELDLVVVSFGENAVSVLAGNGAGSFMANPPITFLQSGGINIYLRDINVDGKLDIITATYGSTIRIQYGNGVGGVAQTSNLLLGSSNRSVAIADFNGDGKLDVVTNYLTAQNAGLAVSLNDGTGQLDTATSVGANAFQKGASVISDFNFDGRPDLAWATGTGVDVRLGLANGDLAAAVTYNFSGVTFLAVGDFNGDFKPDLATANDGANNIAVFMNNGSGGFAPGVGYGVGSSNRALVVGDFNNDGKLDLAIACYSIRSIRVFTGDGLGNFLLTSTSPLNANPASIVSGDFNNDGNLDVVTANECDGGGCTSKLITLIPGNGAGSFGPAVDVTLQLPIAGIFPNFLATADFNGDSKHDLMWARLGPPTSFAFVQVVLNAGGGTFPTPIILQNSLDTEVVAAGDVNNDGKPDIVGASQYGEIQVYLNNGGASFAFPVNYTGKVFPSAVTIGDINNDGKRDIVFAHSGGTFSGSGFVWRLLNKCALSRGAHTSDFDGDGITDLSVFRPSTGTWYLLYSSDGSFHAIPFGTLGDVPVIGDYDGDGKSDVAVFRPSSGVWYYLNSSDGSFHFQQFGANGDIPVPGDYDGDGLTNFAIWRPSTGYWYTSLNPATNFGAVLWGAGTDRPVPADYDGDGRTDVAVYRPSTAFWYLLRSSLGYQQQQFGIANDIPVPADFDGDGKANFGVFRESTGWWYTSLNPATNFGGVQLGQSGDFLVPGFYDADGRADVGIFRAGDWYIHQSNTGNVVGTHFGSSGDEPAPSAVHHP